MKSPSPSQSRDTLTVELPRWRRRLLAAAIAMEAAWIAVLAVLAIAR